MGVVDELRQRQLDRMRTGKSEMVLESIPSDSEIRFGLVPLTEAEYRTAMQAASALLAPENMAGVLEREREQNRYILLAALREPTDPAQAAFKSVNEMMEILTASDVDHLIDCWQEMTDQANPSIDGIPPDEFEALKKVLQTLPWSALSGKSWYAAKRFLGALISDGLLRANSLGSTSTKQSTTTSE